MAGMSRCGQQVAVTHLFGWGAVINSIAPISTTRSPFSGSSPVVSVSMTISRILNSLSF
jgi:hypothetical protein